MSIAPPLAELVSQLKRTHTLASVADLLGWDEQVNLPPASAEHRAGQLALLAELLHAATSTPRVGELLQQLEAADGELNAEQRAIVRQARRDYNQATKLPAEFVREKAVQSSRGFHAWARAKAGDDFASYVPFLEKNLEFAKQEAVYLGHGAQPYDYMLDLHDPGITAATIDRLFAELKRDLVPLMRTITASPMAAEARKVSARLRGFPVDGQRKFLREVTERIGFDYTRGRIDVSLHPFCSGSANDVRMTTRYHEDQPLDALFSSIHETGHGLYEQGLPAEHLGTALGMHAGMAMHESQSRMWENQVARSRGFWRFFEPRWREAFPAQTGPLTADELYLAVNVVEPTLIRVDADEVTYNLHIILRFEIEKRLFSGELAVRDLPAAWRASAQDLLGLVPGNDREGVLQDVHWSGGGFGYFPSYCLGNMIAAQIWYRVLAERPGLEDEFARGEFRWLLDWLRTNVHAQARRQPALDLVRRITGEELSPRHLVRYLSERYGKLYGVV